MGFGPDGPGEPSHPVWSWREEEKGTIGLAGCAGGVAGRNCRGNWVTESSPGNGAGGEAELLCHQGEMSTMLKIKSLSGFKKHWHRTGAGCRGQGQGQGQARFCNPSLSQLFHGPGMAWGQGSSAHWSLAQWGGGVLTGT